MTAQEIYDDYVVNFYEPGPWSIPYTVNNGDGTYSDDVYSFDTKDEAIVVPELQAIMDLPNFYCWPFDMLLMQAIL